VSVEIGQSNGTAQGEARLTASVDFLGDYADAIHVDMSISLDNY
jgi:hypothetical protein